jgi:hypothetical protein
MSKVREKKLMENVEASQNAESKQEEQRRLQRHECGEKIQELLDQYGCAINATVTVGNNRVIPSIFLEDIKQ